MKNKLLIGLVSSMLLAGNAFSDYKIIVNQGKLDLPASQINPFTSHTFTNCGKTGHIGPSLQNCLNAYGQSPLTFDSNNYSVSNGIQSWKVPYTGTYKITAVGARGGKPLGVSDSYRGKGAKIQGEFNLTKGQWLKIVVGQEGLENTAGNTANGGGNGGGGSFVWVSGESNPLIVAGGGGGSSIINVSSGGNVEKAKGKGGVTTNNGGTTAAVNLVNNGTNGSDAKYSRGAKGWNSMSSSLNFSGIITSVGNYNNTGGFGGGGAAADSQPHAGGGGGGYSGGGGGKYGTFNGGNPNGRDGGGGGGSYNSGTNQSNIPNDNFGHGRVIIEGGI